MAHPKQKPDTLRTNCINHGDCAEFQVYASKQIDSAKHEFNKEFNGIIFWFIPLLIVGIYLVLSPILRKIAIRSTNLRSILGTLLFVIGGFIVTGIIGGFIIGFGMCFGKNCSATTEAITSLIPALFSLLITVPLSKKLFLQHNQEQAPSAKPNLAITFVGLAIILCSSAIYLPKLISAINKYDDVKKSYAIPGVLTE